MKKLISLLGVIMMIAVITIACGTIDESTPTITPDPEVAYSFEAEIIETGDSLLVAPNKDSKYNSPAEDVFAVHLTNTKIKDRNGEEVTKEDLKTGDFIKIYFNGTIAESYPGQLTASVIEVTGHNNLIDGYLALIDDIYQEDSGLNGDIEMIALDTTEWAELTDKEKEAIFLVMKEKYGLEIIEGTFDSLSEEGVIEKDNLLFPNGILIKITNIKYDNEKEKITCAIEKWRGGDGAIGSDDVKAEYDGTEWKIEKNGMWIS